MRFTLQNPPTQSSRAHTQHSATLTERRKRRGVYTAAAEATDGQAGRCRWAHSVLSPYTRTHTSCLRRRRVNPQPPLPCLPVRSVRTLSGPRRSVPGEGGRKRFSTSSITPSASEPLISWLVRAPDPHSLTSACPHARSHSLSHNESTCLPLSAANAASGSLFSSAKSTIFWPFLSHISLSLMC